MSKILISACLLGQNVRYDGKNSLQDHAGLQALIRAGHIIPLCPEMAGGLPTPRPPAEIQPGKSGNDVLAGRAAIIDINGKDVTSEFMAGAYKALELAQKHNISVAILKARSPSCGSKQIYDGNFSGTIVDGIGTTAALLSQHGIHVFDETQIDDAIKLAKLNNL